MFEKVGLCKFLTREFRCIIMHDFNTGRSFYEYNLNLITQIFILNWFIKKYISETCKHLFNIYIA